MVKSCDENNPKAKDGKHVCNEKTGKWVSKTGKLGQTITGVKIINEPKPKKKVTALQKLKVQLKDEAEKKDKAIKHVIEMDKLVKAKKPKSPKAKPNLESPKHKSKSPKPKSKSPKHKQRQG